jgi:hypothetical protein
MADATVDPIVSPYRYLERFDRAVAIDAKGVDARHGAEQQHREMLPRVQPETQQLGSFRGSRDGEQDRLASIIPTPP